MTPTPSRSPIIALIAVAWALVLGGSRAAGAEAALRSLLALGDSYTIGQSVPEEQRWPVQLAAALRAVGTPVSTRIIATTGWTTDELLVGIASAAPKGPYDLVTLQIGVNDQFRGGTADTYGERFTVALASAIALAGGRPSRVIVASIPDWGVTPFARGRDSHHIAAAIDAFNAVAKARTEKAGAAWIDITPISRRAADDHALIAADGLHPAGSMYASWVEHLLPAAQRALGTAGPTASQVPQAP